MWELIKDFAGWTGWFPITVGAIIVMLLGRYFYDREITFKNLQINKLKDDLEDSKQYRVDVLVQNLTQRVQALNKTLEDLNAEKETGERQRKTIEQEKDNVLSQLEIAHSDIINLKERLKSYEEDLEGLIEDYCEICDPDEDHPGANFIEWGTSMYEITGDEDLVDKVGYCNYCTSPQIKCNVCGSVTSINLDSDEQTECNGGCGVIFTLVSYVEDKSLQYSIRASRMELESDN